MILFVPSPAISSGFMPDGYEENTNYEFKVNKKKQRTYNTKHRQRKFVQHRYYKKNVLKWLNTELQNTQNTKYTNINYNRNKKNIKNTKNY